MGMIRPAVIVLAVAMTTPAFYRLLVTEDLDLLSALIRFLIAVPVAAVMLAGLRLVTASYGTPDDAAATPAPQPAADD